MSANTTATAHGTAYQDSHSERDAHREVGAAPQPPAIHRALGLPKYSEGCLPPGRHCVPGPGNLTQEKGAILALLRIVNHLKGVKDLYK